MKNNELIDSTLYFKEGNQIIIETSDFNKGLIPNHSHDFMEIVYILEGSGYHILNGTKHFVQQGDLFMISPKSSHSYLKLSDTFKWINCCFYPNVIDINMINSYSTNDFLKMTYFSTYVQFQKITFNDIELKNYNTIENLFMSMKQEYDESNSNSQEILKHYLFILLIKIFEKSATQNKAMDNSSIIDKVLEYLENADDKIKLEDIAKKIFISPNYLRNLIKKHTGRSFTDIVHDIKIDKASTMLSQGYTVSAIMNQIGIYDTKSFYKLFKKHTGITVSEYRKKYCLK